MIDCTSDAESFVSGGWALGRGEPAWHESSVAKAHATEAVGRIARRALRDRPGAA